MIRLAFTLAIVCVLVSCGKSSEGPKKGSVDEGYGPSEADCNLWESAMAVLAKQRASGTLPAIPDFGEFLAKDAATSKAVDAACTEVGMPKERFLRMSARMHKGLKLEEAAWAKVGPNDGDVSDKVRISLGDGDPGFDAWVNNNWKRIMIFEGQLK